MEDIALKIQIKSNFSGILEFYLIFRYSVINKYHRKV